ncbi:hypothetical protein FB107DRAFT_252588 [Schizophyllum commune]
MSLAKVMSTGAMYAVAQLFETLWREIASPSVHVGFVIRNSEMQAPGIPGRWVDIETKFRKQVRWRTELVYTNWMHEKPTTACRVVAFTEREKSAKGFSGEAQGKAMARRLGLAHGAHLILQIIHHAYGQASVHELSHESKVLEDLLVLPGWQDLVYGFVTPVALRIGRWELAIIKIAVFFWVAYTLFVVALRGSCDIVVVQAQKIMCALPEPLNIVVPFDCRGSGRSPAGRPSGELSTRTTAPPFFADSFATTTPPMDRIIGNNPLSLEMVLVRHHIERISGSVPSSASVRLQEMAKLLNEFSAEFSLYSEAVHTAMFEGHVSDVERTQISATFVWSTVSGIRQYLQGHGCISRLELARERGRSLLQIIVRAEALVAHEEALKRLHAISTSTRLWSSILTKIGSQSAELQRILAGLGQLQSIDDVLSGAATALYSMDIVLEAHAHFGFVCFAHEHGVGDVDVS